MAGAAQAGALAWPDASGPWHWCVHDSPLGPLLLVADAAGALVRLRIGEAAPEAFVQPQWRRDEAALDEARRQIDEYFAGRRRHFTLALAPPGTAFRRQVWRALLDVPFGETVTYGQVARRIGKPGAARAVGQANGANPIPLIIPCHRVVAAQGIGGYTGGLEIKRRLLALEGVEMP